MKTVTLTSFLIAVSWCLVQASLHDRRGKFFPFISFPQDSCVGDAGQTRGVCYSSKQCASSGGRRIGNCAHGYGTCCAIENDGTSGTTVAILRNLTTILSPPRNLLPRSSHFIFPRQRGVCQLKLTFDRFQIGLPDRNTSQCLVDFMRITGSVTVDNLEICGVLPPNEHMYLDYGQGNQIDITFNTVSGESISGAEYGYRFRVMQIKCDSATRVAQNCLQHYTNETARVTSFNFPYQQLNNQRYTVCVQQRDPSAHLMWSPCPVPMNALMNWFPFSITGNNTAVIPGATIPPLPPPFPPPIGSGQPGNSAGGASSGTTCAADYVEFFAAGKFCVSPFVPVTTPAYEMFVNFDSTEPHVKMNPLRMPDCSGPNYPPTQPGYQPWISGVPSPPDTTDFCIALPLSTGVDNNNLGFCLMYNTVYRRTI